MDKKNLRWKHVSFSLPFIKIYKETYFFVNDAITQTFDLSIQFVCMSNLL